MASAIATRPCQQKKTRRLPAACRNEIADPRVEPAAKPPGGDIPAKTSENTAKTRSQARLTCSTASKKPVPSWGESGGGNTAPETCGEKITEIFSPVFECVPLTRQADIRVSGRQPIGAPGTASERARRPVGGFRADQRCSTLYAATRPQWHSGEAGSVPAARSVKPAKRNRWPTRAGHPFGAPVSPRVPCGAMRRPDIVSGERWSPPGVESCVSYPMAEWHLRPLAADATTSSRKTESARRTCQAVASPLRCPAIDPKFFWQMHLN